MFFNLTHFQPTQTLIMTKRILFIATLLTFGLLFTACHDQSSKQGIPPADEEMDANTETTVVDDHAGHEHGTTEEHEHGTELDTMESK